MAEENENNKRIAKNTALLYIRMLFQMLVGLYASRLVLQNLGIVDYGLYNVVGGVVAMFEFLNGSMGTATSRFLNFELGKNQNAVKLRQVFSTTLIIHTIIALIVVVLAETIGLWYIHHQLVCPDERMHAIDIVYQTTIIATVLSIISVPYNAAIVSHEKMGAFAYISIFEVSANLLIVYSLSFITYDHLITYSVLILALKSIVFYVYIHYCKRNFQETIGEWLFDKSLFKEMGSFALWIMNGSFAAVCYTQGLNLLLNAFFGPAVNAARGVAVQVQSKIVGFSSNFQTATKPQIIKSYASGDFDYMHKLIINTSKYSVLLLFLLSLPIILEIPFILKIWLKEVPKYTDTFVVLTLCVGIIESLRNPINTAIHATGNIKTFQIVEGTLSLMILPAAYVALKFGCSPISVFVVQIIGFVILQFVRLFLICPKIGMRIRDYILGVFFPCIKVIIPSAIIGYWVKYLCNDINEIIAFFVVCIFVFMSTTIITFALGVDKDMKRRILSIAKNKIGNYKL